MSVLSAFDALGGSFIVDSPSALFVVTSVLFGTLKPLLTLTVINITERAGFDLPSLCKVLNNLILQLNSNDSKDLNSLVDLLFLHDFLLSCDAF